MILENDIRDMFLDDEYQLNEFLESKDAKEQALQDMFEENIELLTEEEILDWEATMEVGVTFAMPTDYFTDENDEL